MRVDEFLCQTASDLMITDVVTIEPTATLSEAAHEFSHRRISGAPVIGDDGVCVGVLSVSDIVGAEERVAKTQAQLADNFFEKFDLILPMHIYEEELSRVRDRIIPASEQPVSNFMTTDVVSVARDAPLREVVRDLVEAHIHRVIVTDDQRRLCGIISTTNIMAALLARGGS